MKKLDDLLVPLLVLVLIVTAIVWVVVAPDRWQSSLILVLSAMSLSILGKDAK